MRNENFMRKYIKALKMLSLLHKYKGILHLFQQKTNVIFFIKI